MAKKLKLQKKLVPFKRSSTTSIKKGKKKRSWIIQGEELEIKNGFTPNITKNGTVVFMKPNGITITASCSCRRSGSCNTVITIDGRTKKKSMKCTSNGCTGGCGIEINIPAFTMALV